MAEFATIDWFGRWGTSVFSENTAIFYSRLYLYETNRVCFHSKGSCSGVGLEVNI